MKAASMALTRAKTPVNRFFSVTFADDHPKKLPDASVSLK
jgi:hypothetical protein